MKNIDPNKVIVFDSDVIIHFIKSGFITSIKDLYPKNKKIILGKLLANDGVLLGKHSNEFQSLMRFKFFPGGLIFPATRDSFFQHSLFLLIARRGGK